VIAALLCCALLFDSRCTPLSLEKDDRTWHRRAASPHTDRLLSIARKKSLSFLCVNNCATFSFFTQSAEFANQPPGAQSDHHVSVPDQRNAIEAGGPTRAGRFLRKFPCAPPPAHPRRDRSALWAKTRMYRAAGSGCMGEGAALGYTTPGCFAKRGWKLLKTKGWSYEKSRKRIQERSNL